MKKFTKIFIFSLAILGVISILSSGCKKSSDNSNNNPPVTTVTDKDGNVYHTVTIGTQVWMVENLKTTKFNDGSSIPLVTVDTSWWGLNTPGYCWYDNNIGYKTTYGALYNWFAVATGKLCPTGWHVPTQTDWNTLATFLGGPLVAGGKLKDAGTSYWETPNTSATNESGFTAYAGGERYIISNPQSHTSMFGYMGSRGHWWSSTPLQTYDDYYTMLLFNDDGAMTISGNYGGDTYGYSVRCIKD